MGTATTHSYTPGDVLKMPDGKRYLIEVDNGALSYSILPTRGMGLWKGRYRDIDLGWSAPVIGPVHPKFVDLSLRGGLGWLTGFDEWLCRCGLAWNGPPGDDDGNIIGGRGPLREGVYRAMDLLDDLGGGAIAQQAHQVGQALLGEIVIVGIHRFRHTVAE